MTNIDALIAEVESLQVYHQHWPYYSRLITALTTERAKVAALEAEAKIAEAKGWRDAVSCVQYCEVHWYQDCRSAEERKALENAAHELVNELVTCSPGEWLGTEWKTAQDYSDTIAKLGADATRWRKVAGELAGALGNRISFGDNVASARAAILAALGDTHD